MDKKTGAFLELLASCFILVLVIAGVAYLSGAIESGAGSNLLISKDNLQSIVKFSIFTLGAGLLCGAGIVDAYHKLKTS